MKDKRAEISVGMVVGIVVVVLTFGILALVYSQLNWSEEVDREVCKQSAMVKGSIPDGVVSLLLKDLISLKCKTKNICVTTKVIGKGKCEKQFEDGEGKYSTYRISSNKEKAEQQIKTLLAREMADCWDMLGRGKTAIFQRAFTIESTIGAVSVICSRVGFDETITDTLGLKKIKGMNRYLLSYKVPNYEISYWDFLRNAYDGETMELLYGRSATASNLDPSKFLDNEIDIAKTKTIFYVESRPTQKTALYGGAAGGIVGAILGFGVGRAAAGAIIGFEALDKLFLSFLKSDGVFREGSYAAGVFLSDYDMEGFKQFNKESNYRFEIASYA